VAVSHHDATPTNVKLAHHMPQCHDRGASSARSTTSWPSWPRPVVRPVTWRTGPAWLDRSVASPRLRGAHRTGRNHPSDEGRHDHGDRRIDAHKRSHTAVAIDASGRKLGQRTTGTTSEDHLALLSWAEQFDSQRIWAVEDCRHLSRRLEADLLGAGESIVRVPTRLMAHARDAARSYGKSDPIDALAVARAAVRETDLPTAQLDGPPARSGCWPTTATISLPSGQG
jgi:hypothetical protein